MQAWLLPPKYARLVVVVLVPYWTVALRHHDARMLAPSCITVHQCASSSRDGEARRQAPTIVSAACGGLAIGRVIGRIIGEVVQEIQGWRLRLRLLRLELDGPRTTAAYPQLGTATCRSGSSIDPHR
jgi:hypothetical protein